jgi:hypothetical protein
MDGAGLQAREDQADSSGHGENAYGHREIGRDVNRSMLAQRLVWVSVVKLVEEKPSNTWHSRVMESF